MSLHRYLPPEEVAALPPAERAKYAAERARFDAEVARITAEASKVGYLDLGNGARWYLRCRGRAGDRPCLARRGHPPPCAPTWGAS